MNAEERLRVVRLVTRLSRAPEAPQDEDAALELAALLKVRPDAPYLLLQRALMLELALEQAQAELAQLRQGQGPVQGYAPSQPASPVRAPSRWGGGWQRGVPAATNPGYTGSNPGYGPGAVAGQAPSAGGSFLRNAAAVGAGVLGGSLLFHGLDSLFHDHDHPEGAAGQGLLSGDMQSPLDAISGNEFADPAQDPLAGGGDDPFSGDMLGDGGEFEAGGDDWT